MKQSLKFRIVRLSPHLRSALKAQEIAWPTVLLFAGSVGLWIAAIVLFEQGHLANWGLVALASLAIYGVYTPLHEAVHGNVSKKAWINNWVGRIAASLMMAPFKGFQYVHLKHHRHTNDDHHDPDFWSLKSFLLLRWLTQDLAHYVAFLKDIKNVSWKNRIEVFVHVAILLTVAALAVTHGHAMLLVLAWLIPNRIVVAWLAYAFNYLAHKDEIRGNFDCAIMTSQLYTVFMLFQNYHFIHHNFQKLPFYQYKEVYEMSLQNQSI